MSAGRFSKNFTAVQQFQASMPPVPFDRDVALRLLRDGVSLIASFYPPDALDWLRKNKPNVIRQLKADFLVIDQAINEENRDQVVSAVDICVTHHRQAFDIYNARPPVIERQESLL